MAYKRDTNKVMGSKGFTGPGKSDKRKFIKQGKGKFKDEATGVAGGLLAESKNSRSSGRAGNKGQTDGGVSREIGYRKRSAPAYIAAPGDI